MPLSRAKTVALILAALAAFIITFLITFHLFRKAVPRSRLVITHALYGVLPDGDSADVTDVLSGLVADDSLNVDASNDIFGDPAPMKAKRLQVDYTYDGVAAQKTIGEGATLRLPPPVMPPSRLVIKKAIYGELKSGPTADVTTQLTELIDHDELVTNAGNNIAGDPAPGIPKQLRIDYTFDGHEASKTYDEGDEVSITEKTAGITTRPAPAKETIPSTKPTGA